MTQETASPISFEGDLDQETASNEGFIDLTSPEALKQLNALESNLDSEVSEQEPAYETVRPFEIQRELFQLMELISRHPDVYRLDLGAQEHRVINAQIHELVQAVSTSDNPELQALVAQFLSREQMEQLSRAAEKTAQKIQPDQITGLETRQEGFRALMDELYRVLRTYAEDFQPKAKQALADRLPEASAASMNLALSSLDQSSLFDGAVTERLFEEGFSREVHIQGDGSGVKATNDNGGHRAGDAYIGGFGKAQREHVLPVLKKMYPGVRVVFSREGGDEFGMTIAHDTHVFSPMREHEFDLDPLDPALDNLDLASDAYSDLFKIAYVIKRETLPINQDVLTQATFVEFATRKATKAQEQALQDYVQEVSPGDDMAASFQRAELIMSLNELLTSSLRVDGMDVADAHIAQFADQLFDNWSREPAVLALLLSVDKAEHSALMQHIRATHEHLQQLAHSHEHASSRREAEDAYIDDQYAAYSSLLSRDQFVEMLNSYDRTLEVQHRQQLRQAEKAAVKDYDLPPGFSVEAIERLVDTYYDMFDDTYAGYPRYARWRTHISIGILRASDAFSSEAVSRKFKDTLAGMDIENLSAEEAKSAITEALQNLAGVLHDTADRLSYDDKERQNKRLASPGASEIDRFAYKLKKQSR